MFDRIVDDTRPMGTAGESIFARSSTMTQGESKDGMEMN
jgi:hypothetical protein